RIRIEDEHARLRVRRLVERRVLLRSAGAREPTDRKACEGEVELRGPRVVRALGPSEVECGPRGVEVVDAHLKVVVLIGDHDAVVAVAREVTAEDGPSSDPVV